MTETDRATIVRDLNRQHDKVLNDLDALIEQVEQVLAINKPSGSLPLEGMGTTEHGRPEVARAQGVSLCAATGEGGEVDTRFNHPSLTLPPSRGGDRRAW